MDQDFAYRPIRAGSSVLRVENDGLTGFVYDRKHEASLRRSGAALLYGIGRSVYDDAKSMRLLAQGTLLLFGLHSDDALAVEVVVGEPLTVAERERGAWLEDGPARIDLPSGTLCLHSFNSLPMGDNDRHNEIAGAQVSVAPGTYAARMYRKQFALEDGADLDDARVIGDVLVLTPVADDAAPSPHNVLFGECIDFTDPALRPQRVVDGVWSGRIGDVAEPGVVAIDLTEDDADALGLRCGDRLHVRAGDVELPVFFFGERHVAANWNLAFGGAQSRSLPDDVVAEGHIGGGRLDWSAFHERRLEIRAHDGSHPFFALPLRTPVTVQVGTPYYALPPPATFAKGVVRGEVLRSTPHGMVLGIDESVFRKLRVAEGGRIALELGGHPIEAVQRRRPGRGAPRSDAPQAAGGPVWTFIGYIAGKGQVLLGVQQDPDVQGLPPEAQGAHALPQVAAGTPVTVRRVDPAG